MKIGILGPPNWQSRIGEFSTHADVLWGTDEPARLRQLFADSERPDALLVHGTVDFLTSDVTELCASRGVELFVLADNVPENRWIEMVPGATRIREIAEIAPPIKPIHEPTDNQQHERQRKRGTVIAVWGPVGGTGASSVAIALSVLAARAGNSVLLCDADTRGASISIGLGLVDEVPGFAAACRLAGRKELSEEHIRRLAIPLESGRGEISVLTGLPRASRWVEIAPPKSNEVIDCARQLADFIVLDVGSGIEENEWIDGAPQRDGASRSLIANADVVVAVGLSDAVGISRLIRGLDDVSAMCTQPLVVLNQTSRQSAREASDAIARFTNHQVVAVIPRDGRGGLEDAVAKAQSSARDVWNSVVAAIDERVQ
ncbi:MAG: CpaE family protein [Microbacteriaceae bacterium]